MYRYFGDTTLVISVLAAITLGLAGCGRNGSGHEGHAEGERAEGAEAGVSFSAKSGLLVPPATAKFIGLQLADVEERTVSASVRFNARIFQEAGEPGFASGSPAARPLALAIAFVSPAQAAVLTNGQTAAVSDGGGTAHPATIRTTKRAFEQVSGQSEVVVSIEDRGKQLSNGMLVSVSVPLGRAASVVFIPRSALLRSAEGDFAYTLSGSRFVRAAIGTGDISADSVEVTDGLYAGDRIVVQPVMTLWLAELQSIRGGKACIDGH